LFFSGFEAKVPDTLRIKLLLNPPDVHGRFSLNQRRLWLLTIGDIDQLILEKVINSFQEYFNTNNWLELSYFDGEEQMLIVKDDDLREACNYFVECYKHFENYQVFLKVFLTEKLSKQAERTTIVKLPERTINPAEAMYKSLTGSGTAFRNQANGGNESQPQDTNDEKLKRMTVKVTNSFNTREVNVKVIDRVTLKCMKCNKLIKLGKAYNIHNMKKHRTRCVKLPADNQSIANLFLAMTAVTQKTKSKADTMIEMCRNMAPETNDVALSELLDKLQEVANRPACLDVAFAKTLRDLCLEVETVDASHPLYICFTELCEAAKVVISADSEHEEDSSNSDKESDSSL
jgi:hypothetical protein